MEKNNLDINIINELDFFIEKNEISLNNSKHIIEALTIAKNEINSEVLNENIDIVIENLKGFSNTISNKYFEDIKIIQSYLKEHFLEWIVDQIDENVEIIVESKNLHYHSIINIVEDFRDYNIDNITEEQFEELNFKIKVITAIFKEYNYLEEEQNNAITRLNNYIESPTLNDTDNILILLKNIQTVIKTQDNNEKEEVKENIEEIKTETKTDVKEKLELDIPEVLNNLYKYFSKFFDRNRNIDQKEIKSLKHIISAGSKYLVKNEDRYGKLILEHFLNIEKHILNLDTEDRKEFKEEEIKEYFENLVIILEEISHIYKKKH